MDSVNGTGQAVQKKVLVKVGTSFEVEGHNFMKLSMVLSIVLQNHMWQSRVEIKHFPLRILIALVRLKHCTTELPLKAGLIHAVQTHEYLTRLQSVYEPHP